MNDIPPVFFTGIGAPLFSKPPLTGAALSAFLAEPAPPTEALIDQFLYARTTLMIAADPKTGKSTVATQLAASLSSGTPCFGKLLVPRPVKVYYLAFETLDDEMKLQVNTMQDTVPVNRDNLIWDDDVQALNLLKPDHVVALLARLAPYAPEVVILDPILSSLAGGLSKDEPAALYCRALRLLKSKLKCALVLLHHTHKERFTITGEKIQEDNPFYGNQQLRGFVHSTYYLKKRDAKHEGVVLLNRDDRMKSSLSTLTLEYHPDTMQCTMQEEGGDTILIRVLELFEHCKRDGKLVLDFYKVQDAIGCSQAHLRRLMKHPSVMERIEFIHSTDGKRTLWKVRG